MGTTKTAKDESIEIAFMGPEGQCLKRVTYELIDYHSEAQAREYLKAHQPKAVSFHGPFSSVWGATHGSPRDQRPSRF